MAGDGLSDRKRTVIIPWGSEEGIGALTGDDVTIIEKGLNVAIDSHMHIQSGACAPLPLVAARIEMDWAIKWHIWRGLLDALGPAVRPDGGELQKHDAPSIAGRAIRDWQQTYRRDAEVGSSPCYAEHADFYLPLIAMPMDMEYAHISGYPPQEEQVDESRNTGQSRFPGISQKIYHEEGDKVLYYRRKSARAKEKDGQEYDVSHERPHEKWKFKKWYIQFKEHRNACRQFPWLVIPMYHYEPRRWRNRTGGENDDQGWEYGRWDYPFEQVATAKRKGICMGFKMYPPLGYRPLDKRLPRLRDFYAKCQEESIPILAHCSPGGMETHDAELYAELDGYPQTTEEAIPKATRKGLPIEYFRTNYVHPKNWREVLEQFPRLTLCLAHFGGTIWAAERSRLLVDEAGPDGSLFKDDWVQEIFDLVKSEMYPNVYTDIAFFDHDKNMPNFLEMLKRKGSEHEKVKSKILFGSDWYMQLMQKEHGNKQYNEICGKAKRYLDSIDDGLWLRLTVVNPFHFFGLDNSEKLSNMNLALEDIKPDKEAMKMGYEAICQLCARMSNK